MRTAIDPADRFSCVVSAGTRFHSHRMAYELFSRGVLRTFISGRRARSSLDIPRAYTQHIPISEYVGLAAQYLPLASGRFPYNAVTDNLFDRLAARLVEPVDIFIGFGNYSFYQMREYRKRGAILVLDQRIAHCETELEMWRREADAFGFPYPPLHLNAVIVSKAQKEQEEADFILTPSEYVWNSMMTHGVPEAKLQLLPYGVDIDLFRPRKNRPVRPSPISVLVVGGISARKGVHYLIDALTALDKSGYNVELWTAGSVARHMRAKLSTYRGIWRHLGHMHHHALAEAYRRADIFCLPSLCEGSALVLGEAAASGLPIVTTTSSGSPYAHGVECLQVAPASSSQLAEALAALCDNPELRGHLGEMARARAERLTWSAYGERLYHLLAGSVGQMRRCDIRAG